MLHKEAETAVMIAVMLGAAMFSEGLTSQALATHDENGKHVAAQQFTRGDDEITNIDAVEVDLEKSILRADGTITIEIVQNGNVIDSTKLSVREITTNPRTYEIDTDSQVEGSFEVVVEYRGTGSVRADKIRILEHTEPAETSPEGDDDNNKGNEDNQHNNQNPPLQQEIRNVVAAKTIPLGDDESLFVKTVEFAGKKSILRATGTVTVAIVQDGKILAADSMPVESFTAAKYSDHKASFDIEVTGEFEVIAMYVGVGRIDVRDINVPGATEPVEEEPPATTTPPNMPPPAADTAVMLTVNAIDQAGNEVVGMWIEVYSGMSTSGKPLFTGETPETFELEQGDYIVAVADFENYVFQGWDDSSQDRTREVTLTKDETFTAVYSTTGGSQPPQDPPTPPPSAGSGSIVVFAHRIPSQHWGPTFTSAGVGMWYVLYNSTGWLVGSGFYDEEGTTITGLNDGETYYVYATDCDECHGDPHDVVFDHWEDMTTENPRAVTTGDSAHAYYRYEPDP